MFAKHPPNAFVTPSNPSPWMGHWGGQRFTLEQVRLMAVVKQPDDAPLRTADNPGEVVTVFRQATSREMWWPTDCAPPVYQFDCPVVGRRGPKLGERNGKVKVIAPNGDSKWVLDLNGHAWVGFPHRLNRHLLERKE